MKQLYTPWGEHINQKQVLQEYPRPALVRNSYVNLNGLWQYQISESCELPASYLGEILVPFSPEAALSGVNRQLQPEEYLWYSREILFDSEKIHEGYSLLLHFGAVDQSCSVYVDGEKIFSHQGGYLPFTVDLTSSLKRVSGQSFHLQLQVQDVSDTSYHSRGKQKLQRGGMYYTAQSGIWQTVWMEYVPKQYVFSVNPQVNYDDGTVAFQIQIAENDSFDRKLQTITPYSLDIFPPDFQTKNLNTPEAYLKKLETQEPIFSEDGSLSLMESSSEINLIATFSQSQRKPWTPDAPYLFPYRIRVGEDLVAGYFAFRSITREPDDRGIMRICLNHKPIYMRGVLDQGYWPDGLMSAPADDAFLFDICHLKDLGYNMIRKHIKIEPQRFYYHCDRLGMIVWQDMVNGGSSYKDWYVTYLATLKSALHLRSSDRHRRLLSREDQAGMREWEDEMISTIRLLKNHPCISTWVIFNEGWGQYDTKRLVNLAYKEDSSRLIDATSGWYDQNVGDMNSYHNYFFPLRIPKDALKNQRVTVLSEFGGYSMAIPEHCTGEGLYGYGTFTDAGKLQEAYERRESQVDALIPQGLCASVYTQVSDIEDEVNGIFTYDRKVHKIKKKRKESFYGNFL